MWPIISPLRNRAAQASFRTGLVSLEAGSLKSALEQFTSALTGMAKLSDAASHKQHARQCARYRVATQLLLRVRVCLITPMLHQSFTLAHALEQFSSALTGIAKLSEAAARKQHARRYALPCRHDWFYIFLPFMRAYTCCNKHGQAQQRLRISSTRVNAPATVSSHLLLQASQRRLCTCEAHAPSSTHYFSKYKLTRDAYKLTRDTSMLMELLLIGARGGEGSRRRAAAAADLPRGAATAA